MQKKIVALFSLCVLDITEYLEKLRIPVQNLQQRMQNIQGNLSEIRDIMSLWAKQPLFERKDGKKDAVLCLDEKSDRIGKRYAEIKAVSEKIQT